MNESTLSSQQKLQTYIDNATSNGLPKDAYLQVTEACNCKCQMCDIWKNKSPKKGEPKTLKAIIQQLGDQEFNWVTLWGGEPYLHPQIVSLMEEVKACNMKLQLITNGTLLCNDRAGAKLDATAELADNVVFSIDAPNAILHDEIRGTRGTFKRAIANMKALAQMVAQKGHGPGIEIDTTILRQNIGNLSQMIEFSKQFGDILVDFDPAQIQGTGNTQNTSIIQIPEHVIDSAFAELIQHAQNGANISSASKLKLMQDHLLGRDLTGPCMSIFKDLLIAPDGKVYFCWGWGKVVGNILDPNFKNDWEQAIKNNLDAIDGNMDRCKKCGFSHVRWPDAGVVEIIKAVNASRKKLFEL